MTENLYSRRQELFLAFAGPAIRDASDRRRLRTLVMAWSTLLERRFVPPTARIAVDAACIGCGYNLRGVRALGPCPECGREAIESLARSGAGRRCGRSLAILGRSLAVPMAAMVLLLAGFGNLGFALLMSVGTGFRLLAVERLRRDVLGVDPVVAARVGVLRGAILAESAVAMLCIGAGVAQAVSGAAPALIALQAASAFLWLMLCTAVVLAALQVVRAAFALRDPDRTGWETIAGSVLTAIAGAALLLALLRWANAQVGNVAVPVAPSGGALGVGLVGLFLAAWGTWGLLLLAGLSLERTSIDPAAMIDEDLVTGAEALRRTPPTNRLSRDPRRPTRPDRSPGPSPPPS